MAVRFQRRVEGINDPFEISHVPIARRFARVAGRRVPEQPDPDVPVLAVGPTRLWQLAGASA